MTLRHRLRFIRRRRVVITALVVLVAAGAGAAAWAATRPAAAASYRLVAARTQTLRQTVSSSGTIEPAQQADLDFGVSGQVTAVNVTVGQQVRAGQALATVNSASLAASVAEAQASLSSDQARVSSDQSDGASSAQLNADQAAVSAAQNQLTNTQNALAEATLTSPIAGTVAAVNLTVGQQVSAGAASSGSSGSGGQGSGSGSGGGGGGSGTGGSGSFSGSTGSSGPSSSSSPNSAQIVVVGSGAYVVNASVDDTEIGQIKPGEQATIMPDGSTTPVYGTVGSVAIMASGSGGVPSFPVTINVTGSPSGLFAGAGATVSITVKQLTDVLVVPAAAVHFANGSATVNELSNGQQVAHKITTGVTENGETQVLSGLAEGDQVVVPAGQGSGGGSGSTGSTNRGGGGGFGGGGFGGGRGAGGFGGGRTGG